MAANAVTPLGPVSITLDLGSGTYNIDTQVNTGPAVTLVIQNGTLVGGSPALIVDSGDVVLDDMTITNSTDTPTIVVNGGSLTVRGSTINQSSDYAQPAIQITGGSVDLGTPTDLGLSTINADGTSDLIANATSTPVSIAGDYFTVNGTSVPINFTVSDTSDTGLGSLPYAVLEANTNPGAAGSIIDFDLSVFDLAKTIAISAPFALTEAGGPEIIQGPGANLLTISGNNAL